MNMGEIIHKSSMSIVLKYDNNVCRKLFMKCDPRQVKMYEAESGVMKSFVGQRKYINPLINEGSWEYMNIDCYYIDYKFLHNYYTLDKFVNYRGFKSRLRGFMGSLVQGLQLIHSKGFVHRDIKPQNIMVEPKSLNVKYIDFGVSCSMNTESPDHVGTGRFMAPEVWNKRCKNLVAADVWSLGTVLFFVVNKRHAFTQPRENIKYHVVHHDISANGVDEFDELFAGMMHPNARLRWSLNRVMEFLLP